MAGTAALRTSLAELLHELQVERLLDAGCGDFRWLREANLPVYDYIGIDVVPGLVAMLRARYSGPAGRSWSPT